jgi:hypothetical protein
MARPSGLFAAVLRLTSIGVLVAWSSSAVAQVPGP